MFEHVFGAEHAPRQIDCQHLVPVFEFEVHDPCGGAPNPAVVLEDIDLAVFPYGFIDKSLYLLLVSDVGLNRLCSSPFYPDLLCCLLKLGRVVATTTEAPSAANARRSSFAYSATPVTIAILSFNLTRFLLLPLLKPCLKQTNTFIRLTLLSSP
jgi:hypothetical protein